MITAADIKTKTFKTALFGGYAADQVDDYLDRIAETLAAYELTSDPQKITNTLANRVASEVVDRLSEML